jgi:hypothetical protein
MAPASYRTLYIPLATGTVLVGVLLWLVASIPTSSSDATRNPHFRRAWPEWVRQTPPPKPDENRILLLSHSQAYGREVSPEQVYAQQWEALRKSRNPSSRVINWAIPAAQLPDLFLTTAAAPDAAPDHIVVVISDGIFQEAEEHAAARSRWASDLYFLLGDASVRTRLHPADRMAWVDAALLGDLLGGRVLGKAWRQRTRPAAWLAGQPLFAPFFHPQERIPWHFPRHEDPFVPPWIAPPRNPASGERPLRWAILLAEAGAPKVTLVDMPIRNKAHTPGTNEATRLAALAAAHGFDYLDARDAVPPDGYLTHTHFTGAGHRRFAAWLHERLP